MVVVTVEVWPHGHEGQKRTIGRLYITNDGTGSVAAGNYTVEAEHAGTYYGRRKGPWKRGRVTGFVRTLSPYRLLCRALQAIRET